MTDKRKSIKYHPNVKALIEDIHADLKATTPKMKSESLVLAYLAAMYEGQKGKISLADHQRYLKAAEEANRQESL